MFARKKWRNIRACVERPIRLPPAYVHMQAVVDYCTRDHEGQYVCNHLHRVPVSLPAILQHNT